MPVNSLLYFSCCTPASNSKFLPYKISHSRIIPNFDVVNTLYCIWNWSIKGNECKVLIEWFLTEMVPTFISSYLFDAIKLSITKPYSQTEFLSVILMILDTCSFSDSHLV